MTIFSHEQSVVFNQVRYTSQRRQKIAVDRAQRQTEINDRQATVKKVTNEMTEMQEDVVLEQKEVASQQEKLAREEAEMSRKQVKIAHEQEVIVQEQAEIIQEQMAITAGQARIAQEQEEISRDEAKIAQEQAEIAHEQEVIAHEQAEIIQKQMAITERQKRIAREQSAIRKVNGAITKLSTVDAGLQADVLSSLDRLDEHGALKPVLLEFDATCRTIFWGNNASVQLTKLQYDIVEILYHAPACRISITSLDERAWGKDMLPTETAAKAAVSRLNKELRAKNFPFEVHRIKRDLKTVPVEHPIKKVVMMNITVQPEIEVYELVRR